MFPRWENKQGNGSQLLRNKLYRSTLMKRNDDIRWDAHFLPTSGVVH